VLWWMVQACSRSAATTSGCETVPFRVIVEAIPSQVWAAFRIDGTSMSATLKVFRWG